jgi:altronate dehydratase
VSDAEGIGGAQGVADWIIQLHPADPIAIAVQDILPGSTLCAPDGGSLVAVDRIPAGHKIALRDLAPGETIHRYGYRIGQASRPITAGSWVHTHNLEVGAIAGGYTCRVAPPLRPAPSGRTCLGYRRPDGRVGTRNYLAVISSVHCVGHAAIGRETLLHRRWSLAGSRFESIKGWGWNTPLTVILTLSLERGAAGACWGYRPLT